MLTGASTARAGSGDWSDKKTYLVLSTQLMTILKSSLSTACAGQGREQQYGFILTGICLEVGPHPQICQHWKKKTRKCWGILQILSCKFPFLTSGSDNIIAVVTDLLWPHTAINLFTSVEWLLTFNSTISSRLLLIPDYHNLQNLNWKQNKQKEKTLIYCTCSELETKFYLYIHTCGYIWSTHFCRYLMNHTV